MKLTRFNHLLVAALILSAAATGCKKRAVGVTQIPGQKPGNVGEGGVAGAEPGTGLKTGEGSTGTENPFGKPGEQKQVDPSMYANYIPDKEALRAQTVYFDFDSSAIKSSESGKLSSVADYLRGHPQSALRIEGNCDERGTEEYNRSLGERRALAAREELIRLGIDSLKLVTVSYGEDQPAVQGHDESAYKKNRRDDFVVLNPPN
jgi:peptidoglycan-associated lipoprotein